MKTSSAIGAGAGAGYVGAKVFGVKPVAAAGLTYVVASSHGASGENTAVASAAAYLSARAGTKSTLASQDRIGAGGGILLTFVVLYTLAGATCAALLSKLLGWPNEKDTSFFALCFGIVFTLGFAAALWRGTRALLKALANFKNKSTDDPAKLVSESDIVFYILFWGFVAFLVGAAIFC